MVDCYCGCDTTSNRIKFAVSAALYLIGVCMVLIIPQLGLSCYKRIDYECLIIRQNFDTEDAQKYACDEADARLEECRKNDPMLVWNVVAVFGGELLMILATIPLCILCCCTKEKPREGAMLQAPVAVVHRGNTYQAL